MEGLLLQKNYDKMHGPAPNGLDPKLPIICFTTTTKMHHCHMFFHVAGARTHEPFRIKSPQSSNPSLKSKGDPATRRASIRHSTPALLHATPHCEFN